MNTDILTYNQAQLPNDADICQLLAEHIANALPKTTSKVWHGHPVWFLDGNPIVGYAKRKGCISLLFWSGQSFAEDGLSPEGTFKAAEAKYTSTDQIKLDDLERWLHKSQTIQWDYKNIVKRRGQLERLV